MSKFFALLIILSISLSALASTPKGWVLASKFETNKVWKHSQDKNILATMGVAQEINIDDYKKALKLSKALDVNKKEFLELIGINDWEATSKKWVELKGAKVFLVEGQYTNTESEKTYFKEYHILKGNEIHKALFTTIDKKSFSGNIVQNFLKDSL